MTGSQRRSVPCRKSFAEGYHGIVSPLNPLYTERELEHALNENGAETVIVLSLFYNKVKAIQPKTKGQGTEYI